MTQSLWRALILKSEAHDNLTCKVDEAKCVPTYQNSSPLSLPLPSIPLLSMQPGEQTLSLFLNPNLNNFWTIPYTSFYS